MFTFVLDRKSGVPLYEQLYKHIRSEILSGNIEGGEKLPSKRELAAHLGVSKVTAEAAYSSLISEGYVYSLEKKGYYCEKDLSIPEKSGGTVLCNSPIVKSFDVDLSSNTVPTDKFPFSVWSKLMREMINSYSRELLEPIPFNGAEALRTAICRYLMNERGMNVTPDRIVIGAGSEYLYGQIIRLLGTEKIYGIENPSYHKIKKVYDMNGADYRLIPVGKNGIDIDYLTKSDVDIVHISPSHNFPTGSVMDAKARHDILTWALNKGDAYIIEDDFDSELRFSGLPIPPLQTLDTDNKTVIYINTFSKTISPSIRIGYMILPPELSEKYQNKLGFNSCTVPSFEQFTLAEFLDSGHFERHINRMKKYYKTLRNNLFEVLDNSKLAEYSSVCEQEAGLHFILKINCKMTDEEIKSAMADRGVRVAFMSDYYADASQSSGEMLINYSGLSVEGFSKAVEILYEITGCNT